LKTTRPKTSFRPALSRELAKLRAHVAETEEMHRAIRTGEVDTMVVAGKRGPHVFTLKGSEHAYRVLIESMNEGALTVTADKLILYANQAFARMVKCPLEQVTGSSFRRFLSAEDRAALRLLLRRADHSGAKIQVLLNAGDGSQMPVQISIRPLPKNGFKSAPIGLVVTDMTAARRSEELLRALTHRVVQAQEAERGRVALELHDHITQLLCAILVRSQTLADHLLARDGPAKKEAMKLREMLGEAAEEVERISRNLRPGILEQLGLVAVLSDTTTEFAKRTGVSLKLACAPLAARLPGDIELTFFRILQEALKNVEKHARARGVSVCLTQSDNFLQLVINDDGVGFNPNHRANGRKGKGGLGLLGMRERATYVGGEFRIKSIRGAGTEIEVRIPLPPKAAKAGDARRKLKTGG
jgi:PAS domain S-box-containing protein